MSAAFIQLPVKDGGSNSRNVKGLSSDGTLSGDISPAHVAVDANGAAVVATATADRSLAITTGGTAQNIMGANAARRAFYVFNPDASEDCWVSFTTTAAPNGQGSFLIAATAGFGMEQNAPGLALSVYCATTGHKLTAWESQ